MHSPTNHSYPIEGDYHHQHHPFSPRPGTSTSSPNIIAGAVPVGRSNRLFHPQTSLSSFHPHLNNNSNSNQLQRQRQRSLSSTGNAVVMNLPRRPITYGNPTGAQNWFGTSVDSTGSSFGHSPVFRDLAVSPSTSASHQDSGEGSTFMEDDEEVQVHNLQEIFDKRRRRRESHNAVERRRRDNINERIHDLCQLLPDHLLDSAPAAVNMFSVPPHPLGGSNNTQRAVNKGTVLRLSVDHIKGLQSEVSRYQGRVKELEQMIEELRHQSTAKISPNDEGLTHDNRQPPPPPPHQQQQQLFQQQPLLSHSFGGFHISPDQLTRHPRA